MMGPKVDDPRPRFPSVFSVYRPIEEYWSASAPAKGLGPGPEAALAPLDALLAHLVLELAPAPPTLIDLASAPTGGAGALIGLGHPRVRRVVAVSGGGEAEARAFAALEAHRGGRPEGPATLEVVEAGGLPALLAGPSQPVILADVRDGGLARLADDLGLWLDARPDALVLLLGLGRVGECPAIECLVRLCAEGSGRRLRLLRELGEVLAASRLGLVSAAENPHVPAILGRIRGLYAGNYQFLELLKANNLAAIRESRIDLDVLRTHTLSMNLVAELRDRWKAELPPSLLGRARRELSRTLLGKLWRVSKRVLRPSRA